MKVENSVASFGACICGKLTIQMPDGAEKNGTQQNYALSIGSYEICRNSAPVEGLLLEVVK